MLLLAIPISIVLVALLVGFLARRHHQVQKWFLSVRTALLGSLLFAVASISAAVVSLRLPIVGVMAILGAMLFATTLIQRSIDDKTSIWARGTKAIHTVTKIAFLVILGTYLLARVFFAVGRYIKGD
jgi:hypothetical protein